MQQSISCMHWHACLLAYFSTLANLRLQRSFWPNIHLHLDSSQLFFSSIPWCRSRSGSSFWKLYCMWTRLWLKKQTYTEARRDANIRLKCLQEINVAILSLDLKTQQEGESLAEGPQDWISALSRWCAYVGFIRRWPSSCTGAVCSQVWSGWDESQHLWVRGYGSPSEKDGLLPLGWKWVSVWPEEFEYFRVLRCHQADCWPNS